MRKIIFFILIATQGLWAQSIHNLPHSTPEAEGVSSAQIVKFLNAMSSGTHEMHSFIMLRHGKVIAQTWWSPYDSALQHTEYSVSKTFTSTAIGFAVQEKILSVDDRVVHFFPDKLPTEVSNKLYNLKIRHLLSMSVGHQEDPTFRISLQEDDWAKAFLATPLTYEPGEKFVYNSMATYMLAAIVERATGKKLLDYLTPRLLTPLGIRQADWESDPMGTTVGGWGLRVKTMDLAKLGQLYLMNGKWGEKQVLSPDWVAEASRAHIYQDYGDKKFLRDSSDWHQGYGYQMWRSRHGYRADGAFGQYILILPGEDVVIAINSETSDMQAELNMIWKYLLPAIDASGDKPVAIPLYKAHRAPTGGKSALEKSLAGKKMIFDANDKRMESVRIMFNKDKCTLTLQEGGQQYELVFGKNNWLNGETTRKGPYLIPARNNRAGMRFRVAGSYRWANAKTLELTLKYLEGTHTEVFRMEVDKDQVKMNIKESIRSEGVNINGRLTER